MQDDIRITGMRENNLKNIDLNLPKNQLIVFTGVSGSGKTSIVYDTIANESQRQWTSAYPSYVRNQMPLYERPEMDAIENLTPVMVVDQKPLVGGHRSTVATVTDVGPLIRLLFSRIAAPAAGEAAVYRRNHPDGKCPRCQGSGTISDLVVERLFDKKQSLREGGIQFSQFGPTTWQGAMYYLGSGLFDPDKKLKDYTDEEWELLLNGPEEEYRFDYHFKKTGGTHEEIYEGVIPRFRRLYMDRDISKLKQDVQDEVQEKVDSQTCPTCEGTGYSLDVLASKIKDKNIVDYLEMQIDQLVEEIESIDSPGVGQSIAEQILEILHYILELNLGYLTLERTTESLSGGEAQRLKLVKALNSSLNNMTYILDEPSVSMHPRDVDRLGDLLLELRDRYNTVLVVEHNPAIIERADQVVDIGPQAGKNGGEILFQGPVSALLEQESLTAAVLTEEKAVKKEPKTFNETYRIEHANVYNLKDIAVDIPKEVLTVVTGVAGAGKSTLINEVFAEKYSDSVLVDQKPIGTSSRSTPATYTGVMDIIREVFGKANEIAPGMFSFNSAGACPVCEGKGELTPDVAYANPVTVVCENCQGTRYSDEARSYTYQGKNIVEVLDLSVDEALAFFEETPRIMKRLDNLSAVGLGYLALGQATSSLSGGENQRLKLASYLHETGNTYIFDEPSAGLHPHDVKDLIAIFEELIDEGNTVIVVEHNLQLISQADWLIDLGPEGGQEGGQILFEGTPNELLAFEELSYTKDYLRKYVSD